MIAKKKTAFSEREKAGFPHCAGRVCSLCNASEKVKRIA
ncbi:Uncharacterized protein dnm_020430 [Desulfonema magnum]|uniref:Uncharacterized protein n=1 Tax=Desulfonema magnum TaxID=45655 RepID=A0A975GLX0_9BACT|nr:Uncharacterized protein dnm_020430 [Desulfonema magnum]